MRSRPVTRGKNTVRATILHRLEDKAAASIKDLSKGLNRNTVRNALWTLRNEGLVVKQGKEFQLSRRSAVMH